MMDLLIEEDLVHVVLFSWCLITEINRKVYRILRHHLGRRNLLVKLFCIHVWFVDEFLSNVSYWLFDHKW